MKRLSLAELQTLSPREKLQQEGVASLKDAELLALFLRTGLPGLPVLDFAQSLIDEFGSLNKLMSASKERLCECKGIGDATCCQIQAVAELAFRYFSSAMLNTDVMKNSAITKAYLMNLMAKYEKEVFFVLFLDNQHGLIRHKVMFSGTLDRVAVYPREIVREALKLNAAAIILAHNHPSGIIEPSDADLQVTKQVITACLLLDIRVLDHFIIGRSCCLSFAEKGLI